MLKYTKDCYLLAGGGLGDILKMYLTSPAWLKIAPLSRNHDISINLILKTLNRTAGELFEYNPYFSNVTFLDYPSDEQYQTNIPNFTDVIKNISIEDQQMPFFLNEKEIKQINDLRNNGKYVVIHPYAGDDSRAWDDRLNLIDLIQHINARGCNVVLVGGTHFRDAAILHERKQRNEIFHYESPRFYNYLNKGVRLCSEAIQHASHIIGSSSCYTTVAWCLNKKTMSVVPDGNFLSENSWWLTSLYQKSTVVRFSEINQIHKKLDKFL